MEEEHKKFIDESSYESLMRRWRFAPLGDTIFSGSTGEYYRKVMEEKSKSVDKVSISKKIGWG